jgi:hypothetical protein
MNNSGYELFFNRDEHRQRGTAESPAIREQNGVKSICPIDPDAGGTWLGVNEFGLTIGILNFYGRGVPRVGNGSYVSRGLMVLSLLDCRGRSDIEDRLCRKELSEYRPFILLLVEPDKSPITFTWDQNRQEPLFEEQVKCPLSTSGFMPEEVPETRADLFRRLKKKNQSLEFEFFRSYHRSHHPEKGPYSVCMHRSDAGTVSFSHVSVNQKRVDYYYADGNPCTSPSLSKVSLARSIV